MNVAYPLSYNSEDIFIGEIAGTKYYLHREQGSKYIYVIEKYGLISEYTCLRTVSRGFACISGEVVKLVIENMWRLFE